MNCWKKLFGTALVLSSLLVLGCTSSSQSQKAQPLPVPQGKLTDAGRLVWEACTKLHESRGHHFKIKASFGMGGDMSGISMQITMQGVFQNPDTCRVKLSMMGQTAEIIRKGDCAVARDFAGLMGPAGKSAKNWQPGLPKDAVKMFFVPFYEASDVSEFLADAKITGEEKVGDVLCAVVEAPVPAKHLDETLDFSKMGAGSSPFGDTEKMKLKKAVYKFWIGREDRVMRRALRIVEYRMSVNPFTGQEIPPDGEKVTMKLEVDAELFDYDRDVEIEIPDEAAAALKEAVEKDATPAK